MTSKERLKYYFRYFLGAGRKLCLLLADASQIRGSVVVTRKSSSRSYVLAVPKEMLGDNRGGAFGIVLVGLSVSIAALLVFVNMVDFALYSYRRNLISKALDNAVSAAVQEIDVERSSLGLAEGFDEQGNISLDNIVLNEERADNAFYSTFKHNTGLERADMEARTMTAVVAPVKEGLQYKLRSKAGEHEGGPVEPVKLEEVLNQRINILWPSTNPEADKHIIYVNGNPRTNEFKKRPYYLVFIRDYQIDGLFRRRTATFVGFKGAKVERKDK